MNDSDLVHRISHGPTAATAALLLLHGRGADERDLVPLLDALDPQRRFVGVTLRAPLHFGAAGYHWYISRELGYPDPTSFLDTYARVGAWLEELPTLTGVGLEATVLGGFSQGAVMAYALALGRGRPSPAALIALSGFIPQARGFALDLPAHRDIAVAIGHGILDSVIPVEFGRTAATALREAGLTVELHESPIGHAIDPSFVADLAGWLPSAVELRRAA